MPKTSVMESTPEFIQRQYEFAAHIRDPDHKPAPGDVEDRRMAIYRELFYNNVEGFLSNTFPVLRELHDDDRWHAMVRDFFSQHLSQTPLFLEIPREFLAWLENERNTQQADLPFMQELAHYEWVELALSISEENITAAAADPEGDFLTGIPVLSPLVWHLAYHYPVHRIGPDYQPDQPGDSMTCLVVYRNREDEVGFMEVNPVTKRLLELVDADEGESGEQLLNRIATEMSHPQPEVVINSGLDIFKGLAQKDIILGVKTP
ncbi:MAG: putative DNA-binding domain-containing protein [Pseudomonadota bacterium]